MPVTETADTLTRDYPGLRQTQPATPGATLDNVRLERFQHAVYQWAGYQVTVAVGPGELLDPDSTTEYRRVTAHAALLVSEAAHPPADQRGPIAWEQTNPRPETVFPAAYIIACADTGSDEFAASVLVAVGRALDNARTATAGVSRAQGDAEALTAWARQCPEGMPMRRWLRQRPQGPTDAQ